MNQSEKEEFYDNCMRNAIKETGDDFALIIAKSGHLSVFCAERLRKNKEDMKYLCFKSLLGHFIHSFSLVIGRPPFDEIEIVSEAVRILADLQAFENKYRAIIYAAVAEPTPDPKYKFKEEKNGN